jgi:hypothetical protein
MFIPNNMRLQMKAYNVSWSYIQNDPYPSIQPVIAGSEKQAVQRVAEGVKVDGKVVYIYEVVLVSEEK